MNGYKTLIASNIDWLMEQKSTNANELAVNLAQLYPTAKTPSQATIFRIVNGESVDPKKITVQPIADYFDITVEQLREWDFRQSGYPEQSTLRPGPIIKKIREYPVISSVQAGQWTELCDTFQPGDANDWKSCHKDLGPCGYVLMVEGPSMTAEPGARYSFPPGMLLYVNPDAEVLPGKFVIVRRNGTSEATFKKLVLIEGEMYLEALNPTWPMRYLKLQEGDQFCGVVMHAGFDMP